MRLKRTKLKVPQFKKNLFERLRKYSLERLEHFKRIDKLTLVLVMILFGIGLLMIYSITSISIYNGIDGDPSNYFIKTIVMGGVGIAVMIFILLLPEPLLKLVSFLALVTCPFILIITYLFAKGSESSNVRSWFTIGGFKLQPAEFVKIGMIMAIAWLVEYLIKKKTYYYKIPFFFKGFKLKRAVRSHFAILLYIGVCAGLVLIQPDFGSALILGFIGLIMFLSTGIDWETLRTIVAWGGTVLISCFIAMAKFFPYQLERFDIWLDPFNHTKGFQNVMGYTAIALGGITGVGLGKSTQKYGYVLEPHNDMISTILAEELGVWMILIIIAIYLTLALRCFSNAIKCKDMYGALVSVGIGAIFLIQPLVNLGGASGAFPLTGVTLPFISYGGSSLVSLFAGIGVYLNVAMIRVVKEKKQKEENQETIKKKVLQFPKS
ncbi:MAG: FtsW/RodA/SpoVE family cell cycle protein [Turicibacter sp.]|nr:FtsW/RodA/SpoVE family cell cycle protein [Turicibacter sp.]